MAVLLCFIEDEFLPSSGEIEFVPHLLSIVFVSDSIHGARQL